MTSFFTKLDKVEFKLPCVLTWGVKKDKHKGYSVPIVPDTETAAKIIELAKDNGMRNPMYGESNSILYLGSSDSLSPKQEKELLDKGKSYVLVNFELEGVNTFTFFKHLSFKITELRRIGRDTHNNTPPED